MALPFASNPIWEAKILEDRIARAQYEDDNMEDLPPPTRAITGISYEDTTANTMTVPNKIFSNNTLSFEFVAPDKLKISCTHKFISGQYLRDTVTGTKKEFAAQYPSFDVDFLEITITNEEKFVNLYVNLWGAMNPFVLSKSYTIEIQRS